MGREPPAHVLDAAAGPDALERVHGLIDSLWADTPDVADADRIGFETAVIEIAANILEHACGGIHVDMRLEVRAHADRVEARFTDTGHPTLVDLASAEMPGELAEDGRGLALARAAVDELSYQRDGAVNRWRIVRRRR